MRHNLRRGNLVYKFYGDSISPHFFIYLPFFINCMKEKKDLIIAILELSIMDDFEDK